jgi:hypothetical protein
MKLEKVVDVSLAVRTLRQIRPNFISDMVISILLVKMSQKSSDFCVERYNLISIFQDQFEAIYRSALTYLQAYDTYGNFQ